MRATRRLGAALACAGAGTFMLLYAAQALLPAFSDDLGVSPATSALTVSATTGALALALLPMGAAARRWGRRRVMTASLTAASLLGLLAALAPSFEVLLVLRTVQGVAIAGVPALAMAHVADEVPSASLGASMGLLVAGNTTGGLAGRLVASVAADLAGWRAALAAVAVLSVLCLVAFRALLPPSSTAPGATAAASGTASRSAPVAAGVRAHLRDPGLLLLCLSAFVLMAAFVAVYNFLGYRLLAEPFALSQTAVGLLFLAYLPGSWGSTRAGRLGDRFSRRRVLPAAVLLTLAAALATLPDHLLLVAAGLVVFTAGFFAAHTTASGWVGQRAARLPAQDPARASALYLLSYYAGSSAGGVLGGAAYARAGWAGLVACVSALLLVALGAAAALRRGERAAGPRWQPGLRRRDAG